MRLGTRLLLPLLPTVVVVMAGYTAWSLIEREGDAVPQARREVQAYSNALGLSFDRALRDLGPDDLQHLIDDVSQEPSIFGVLLYDSAGTATAASAPLDLGSAAPVEDLAAVLASGEGRTIERTLGDQRVLTVLRPLRSRNGRIAGVLEVAQPLAFLEQAKAKVQRRFLLNTLTLLAAVAAIILLLVRRMVVRPLGDLVAGVKALGAGRLAHRLPEDPAAGEVAEVAHEFNRLAANLEAARADAQRESEGRALAERRLREAEKAAAVGNLAAGLAHEIAAPLTVISGRAEVILRTDPEPQARNRHLEIIVREISRITAIVRSLLDLAKRKEPVLQDIDLRAVMDEVLEVLDGEVQRHRITVDQGAPEAVPMRGDPDLLHQVLTNLVHNAIQAMEGVTGPRVLTIRLTRERADAEDLAVLTVADSGPGIPDNVLARVFQPFFTTKPNGTGLGLVLARRIVEEHGGRLDAENMAAGARFRVTLPTGLPAPAEVVHA